MPTKAHINCEEVCYIVWSFGHLLDKSISDSY